MQQANIVSLFVEDHEKIALLLKDFNKSQNKEEKAATFHQLSKDLIRHFHQEEILYSKYMHTTGAFIPVIKTARKEHEVILRRIKKIENEKARSKQNCLPADRRIS